jgi:hypothetical protein
MLKWMVVALVAVVAAPTWAQQWVEYRPAGTGYRVEFPGPPTPYTDDAGTPANPIRMFGGELELEDGRIYYSSVYNDEKPWSDPDARLSAGRDGAVRGNPGSILRDERRLTIGGVPARRLVIDVKPKKQVIVLLIAVSGGRFYQVSWTGPEGRENDANVNRFVNSFAFVAR